jgi:hypothetical protein
MPSLHAPTPAAVPCFSAIVPPHHLVHLLGQGNLFVRNDAGTAVASLSLVQTDDGNVVPLAYSFESHSSDAPWGQIKRTLVQGRCVSCYDNVGTMIAFVVVQEVPLIEQA